MNTWYNNLKKSQLTPPDWLFKIVWPILYTLMFFSLFTVWSNKQCYPYCDALTYFFIQLGLNLIWTTLFFYLQKPIIALVDIILIIIFTIITFNKFLDIDKNAAYILLPYIFWLGFAFYLNASIVYKNKLM